MSDPDRGAYTPPTDAPLSFDARQPVRGGGPAPVMLILSALVLIALVVAIFMFYRSGVREAGQPPRTVGEPVAEMKAPPPAEDQPADPAAGLQIYQSEGGETATPASPNFTAPPEQPQARPTVTTPPPRPAPTVPIAAAPLAPAPAPGALKPAVQPPAPVQAQAPATKVIAPPPKAAAPKSIDAALAAAPKPAAPKAAGGAAAVQIGAFSSQALADSEWSKAVQTSGGAGKGKKVEAVQKGSSTLYRTQVTGFGSRADASAFCDKLKAAGKNCFVK